MKTFLSASKKAFICFVLVQFYFAQISFSQALNLQITAIQHVPCNGGSNGSATAQANGGVPPYTYSWSNGGSGPTINNLSAGTYTCTVTDLQMATASKQAVVTQPSQLQMMLVSQQNIDCSNPLGSATVAGSGGTMPYAYNWSNGSNGPTVNNLTAGTHTVTVEDDHNCTVAFSINILDNTDLPSIVFSAPPLPLTCDRTSTNINASMSSNGPQFSYSWTGPGIVSGQGTLIVTVNQPGSYTLEIVNNSTGCVAQKSILVNQMIMPPMVLIDPPDVLTCAVPLVSVDASFSSSGPGFSYMWSTIDGNIVSGQGSNTIEVDAPGQYKLKVTNSNNGCTAENSVVVSQNIQPPVVEIVVDGPNVLTCDNPTVILSYGDDWQWGYYLMVPDTSLTMFSNSLTIDHPGSYILFAQDTLNGCIGSDTIVIIEDKEPPAVEILVDGLSIDADGAPVINCYNPEGTLTTGGNILWEVVWEFSSSGGPFTDISNDTSIIVDQGGIYVLQVQDTLNGCMGSDTIVIVEDKAPPVFDIIVDDPGVITCDNLTVTIHYGDDWMDLYYLELPDISLAMGPSVTIDHGGTFVLFSRDTTNGCIGSDTAIIHDLRDPFPYTIEAIDASQPGDTFGQIRVSYDTSYTGATWALEIISYQLNNDTTYTIQGAQSGEFLVPFGFYGIKAQSLGCCKYYDIATTNPSGSGCVSLQGTILTEDVTCLGKSDGSIVMEIQGANGPVNFLLEFDPDSPNYEFQTIIGYQSGAVIGGLPASNLAVYGGGGMGAALIQDAAGCSFASNFIIGGAPSLGLVNCPNDLLIDCTGALGAALTLSADFALNQSQYEFQWSTGETDISISGLPAGQYWVLALVTTSIELCSDTFYLEIKEPVPFSVTSATIYDPQEDNYEISVQVNGGISPYTYIWANETGILTDEFLDRIRVPPGCYWVTIVDSKNCEESIVIKIMPSGIVGDLSENQVVVYPNPSTGSFIIKSEIADQFRRIEVFDVVGKAIFAYSDTMPGSIDLSFFESGIYYLKITMEGGEIIMRPLVKI